MSEIKPDADFWSKHPSAQKILLDPAGRALDSNNFADVFAKAEMVGRDLVFVIGGHNGLPQAWRDRADLLVSLSSMTMPHELARAVLAEQIYRAFTILRGHPYPR
jgi:23S rRNA (pseudouridine1915-N3)-methyltransferase